MMRIAVLYATREGHTQRIAEHVAAMLRSRGFDARTHNLRDSVEVIRLETYSGAILAASVHFGRHEREMIEFVKEHRAQLESIPCAFLSVTLSEAGAERSDAIPEQHARFAADVEHVIDRFLSETGWHPQKIKPVAGALLYTRYNVLLRFVMKQIAKASGGDTDTSRDHEYTDWVALDKFVQEFTSAIPADVAQ